MIGLFNTFALSVDERQQLKALAGVEPSMQLGGTPAFW